MRVLVMSTWMPSAQDPGQTPFILRHVRAIAARHQVQVLHVRLMSEAPVEREQWDGFPVTRVSFHPGRPWTLLAALPAVRALVRGADLVHTMAFSTALVAPPVVAGKPWLHTEHWNGVATPELVSPLWEKVAWLRHVMRLPDRVTGVSALMCSVLSLFAEQGKVSPIANVVDYQEELVPAPQDPGLRIATVGGIHDLKDPVVTVDTVAWLRDQGHDVHLTWCGSGVMEGEVRSRISRLGLQENVEMLGNVPAERVQQVLADSHVFFLPSRTETFCVAAAEALAAGRPVVLGAVGGQKDFVHQGNGRLVADRTPENFGRALLAMRSGEGVLPLVEMAAEVRGRYGLDAVTEQIDQLYRRVLEEARL